MKPYYEHAGGTIYHGDCRQILPYLKFDSILTDPPYGLGDKWTGGGGENTRTSWRFDPNEAKLWDQTTCEGVLLLPLHHIPTVIWGGNNYALPPSRCWFVWDKKQNDSWTTGQAELAWTNLDRPTRVFRMAQCEYANEGKWHPTQKPFALISWCFKFLPPGRVLDPYMGSGTTLLAAKQRGIEAIGIEIEERYCEIAAKRLAQEVLEFA